MKQTGIFSRLRRLDGPVALLMLSAGLGLLAGYQRGPAWTALGWLASGAMMYTLVSRISAEARLRAMRIAILGAGMVGFYLVTQIGHYADLDKVALIERVTGWVAGMTPDLARWKPMPNSAATLLEGLLFLGIGAALGEKQAGWRRTLWVASGLVAAGLAVSESRGAWIAVVGAGLFWLALRYRPARYAAAVLGVGMAGLAGTVLLSGDLSILERVPLINRTIGPVLMRPDRLELYRGALQLIQDLPLTGVGLGPQFAMNYSKFVLLIQVPFLTYAHNFFLESWLQMGLIGAVAAAWLTAAVGAAGTRLAGNCSFVEQGIWAGVAAMLLHGLTDARMYADGWCWIPFFFLLGLLASGERGHQPAREGLRWRKKWSVGLAGLVLVGAAAAALPATAGAFWTNQGALKQARAELSENLSVSERTALRAAAEADFRRSLAKDLAARAANLRLGLLLSSEERFAEAVGPLEAALRAEPDNPTSKKALGLAYMWVGRVDEASLLVKDARKMTEELNTWGYYQARRGQVDLARRAYMVSLRLDAGQDDVRTALKALD